MLFITGRIRRTVTSRIELVGDLGPSPTPRIDTFCRRPVTLRVIPVFLEANFEDILGDGQEENEPTVRANGCGAVEDESPQFVVPDARALNPSSIIPAALKDTARTSPRIARTGTRLTQAAKAPPDTP